MMQEASYRGIKFIFIAGKNKKLELMVVQVVIFTL